MKKPIKIPTKQCNNTFNGPGIILADGTFLAEPQPPSRTILQKILSIVSFVLMVLGLIILLYPVVLDWHNTFTQSEIIRSIENTSASYDVNDPIILEQIEQAIRWNASLPGVDKETFNKYANNSTPVWDYDKQLSVTRPYMAYLEIPKIAINMPIYHKTDEESLSIGVGHLENTSLPVPGKSVHVVVSAHSGMIGMRAFDDIRELVSGDKFYITTLGRTYAYKVFDTQVVLPHETQSLLIRPGEDLATLVTCTPYGINDHRLLVHGVHIPSEDVLQSNTKADSKVVKERVKINIHMLVNKRTLPGIIGSIIILLAIIFTRIQNRKVKKQYMNRLEEFNHKKFELKQLKKNNHQLRVRVNKTD